MLRIYLDQKDWIALLKAAADRPERASHADALALLRAGVDAGAVSLPLSHIHYQETSHRRPYAKRLPLASLMAELSRFHAIAPFYKLAKDEMRHFIATHFEAPIAVPDPPEPFGRGGDHAFGYGVIAESLEGLKAKFRPFATGVDQAVDELGDVLELGLLTGHPEHDTGPAPGDRLLKLEADEAGRREERRHVRLRHRATTGELSHRSKYATAYYEKQDDVLAALADVGVKKMPGNAATITWFVENVSSIYCDYELSRLKEEATNRPWTANDVRDVWALSAAVVYADVVVTEKSWATLINRGLAERYGTVVQGDVSDIIEVVLAAAA
jgi:hypothetical protein